jgi:hypothetical protein
MPGASYLRAGTDGGPLKGGAPRVVWLTLGVDPRTISARSAAQRLSEEDRPSHLVWNPLTGEVTQLIPIVRAGCALGTPERPAPSAGTRPWPAKVNSEGRICVQVSVLGCPWEPFTHGPMTGLGAILSWLDSWQVPRRWPAGRPAPVSTEPTLPCSRAQWARGGYFGASQVPGCEIASPGDIDIERLTGPHALPGLDMIRPRSEPHPAAGASAPMTPGAGVAKPHAAAFGHLEPVAASLTNAAR